MADSDRPERSDLTRPPLDLDATPEDRLAASDEFVPAEQDPTSTTDVQPTPAIGPRLGDGGVGIGSGDPPNPPNDGDADEGLADRIDLDVTPLDPGDRGIEIGGTTARLERPRSDVFWFVTALANWDGDATLDFESLSVAFRTPLDDPDDPGAGDVRSFDIHCLDDPDSGDDACLLEVNVVRLTDEDFVADPVAEQRFVDTVRQALGWDLDAWQDVLQLDADYVALPARLEVAPRPIDAQISLNQVVVGDDCRRATATIEPGYQRIVASAEGYESAGVGLYYARVEGRAASLFAYASAIAPPMPTIALSSGTALAPPPRTLPKPPTPPGIVRGGGKTTAKTVTKAGKKVLQGTAKGIVRGVAKKAVVKVVGKVLVPVGVAIDVYEISVAVKLGIEVVTIRRENSRRNRFCCCAWVRRQTVYSRNGAVIRRIVNGRERAFAEYRTETFSRFFYRTVPRSPNGKCNCKPIPTFATVQAPSEFIAPGQLLTLTGGPPNGRTRIFVGGICPARDGETTPANIDSRLVVEPL